MIDLVAIDLIDFHDLSVDSIKIETGTFLQLELVITILNESTNEYNTIKVSFENFKYLKFDKLKLDNESELEIYSFNYHLKDDFFYGKMELLLGFGKPSFMIDFASKKVLVEKNKE